MAKFGNGKSKFSAIVTLFLLFAFCFLFFSLLAAFVAMKLENPLPLLPLFSLLTLLCSGLFGGFIGRKTGRKNAGGVLWVGSAFAVAFLVTAFAVGGHIGWNTVLFLTGYLAMLVLGVLLGGGGRKFKRGVR